MRARIDARLKMKKTSDLSADTRRVFVSLSSRLPLLTSPLALLFFDLDVGSVPFLVMSVLVLHDDDTRNIYL